MMLSKRIMAFFGNDAGETISAAREPETTPIWLKHFRCIGHINVASAASAVARHVDEFGTVSWRETAPGTPHPDTETLYLRMPREITRDTVFNSFDCHDLPLMADPGFSYALDDVLRVVTNFYTAGYPCDELPRHLTPLPRRAARVMVVKLNPGGKISAHIDQGTYAEATDRWHVAIETNPDAWLEIDGERLSMKPGEVTWFDKHAEHFGANEGETPRTHLIVDTWR